MNFKEQYLHGLCGIDHIEACIGQWHERPEDGVSLIDYLGLTQEEYNVFLQTDVTATFQSLLDSQRRIQSFRIYQLDFDEGKTIPFAFAGLSKMHEAGYAQPPAAQYCLVYDGTLFCPKEIGADELLEMIFTRFNNSFPADYPGRSVSVSDVIELYDGGTRNYFYCNSIGFAPVKFSPMLAKQMRK